MALLLNSYFLFTSELFKVLSVLSTPVLLMLILNLVVGDAK